jgi:hypothetical protein
MRMTEQDGAWMARILANFGDDAVKAAVKVGQYEPINERYLVETLIARRNVILQRYFAKVSPIAHVSANQHGVCGVDLARATGVVPNEEMSFRAYLYRGSSLEPEKPRFRHVSAPTVCVDIPHHQFTASLSLAPDAAERYVIVDITNGYAPGPLRVHLYDLGEQEGYRLAGIERPIALSRPD